MSNKITCINKNPRNDPYNRITHVGFLTDEGQTGKISQEEAIQYIERGYVFYVEVGGRRVNVNVGRSRFGNKYIRTEADNDEPNNLLNLLECI